MYSHHSTFLLNEDELLYGLCVKKNLSVLHQPAYLLGYAYVSGTKRIQILGVVMSNI